MKNVIRKILYAGIKPEMSLQLSRTIILTNAIALITLSLGVILLTYFQVEHHGPWRFGMKITLATILVLALILVANRFGLINLGRTLLSVLVPVMIEINILIPRLNNSANYHYHYDPRTSGMIALVMVTTVVPLMVFSNREWKLLFPTLGINVAILMMLDPILYVYSIDHVPNVYNIGHFLSGNMLLVIAEFFLIGSTIFLKSLFEKFEKENELLLASQHEKNVELRKRNRDIEAQNHEIQAQSEELLQSQEQLVSAHNEIERQKQELEIKNLQLEQSLDSKSKDLLHTNQQLITQNQELQQFSYTVSHNLRGPVASMLGLINIFHLSTDEAERKVVFSLLEKSTHALETVIHDLNKIIDIRRDKFNVTEKVDLHSEINLIMQSLKIFITENDVTLNLDLQEKTILSIKAYINSVLYNLISNAIQYRSPERKPVINISARREGHAVIIRVSDNGLGIDLIRFGTDIFKLYKRFHTHVEGKGLGLFIVKQQVEKLDGTIEVVSAPNQGATFVITLLDAKSP